jgi:hypothetical protein
MTTTQVTVAQVTPSGIRAPNFSQDKDATERKVTESLEGLLDPGSAPSPHLNLFRGPHLLVPSQSDTQA